VDAEAWRLLDILAGLPAVYPETVEAFVPQMLNLQHLGGISFKKGCYTGQEIVARTQYLGKLKRRMVLARVDSPTPPCPGDPLFSPHVGPSQSAGQLADAAHHPEGGYAVLAVALIELAEQQALHLGDASGPILHLKPLPYES
jgi:folate-binding protein YgfZ